MSIEDIRFYKPNLKGTGAASKLQLRLKPKEVTTREGRTVTVKKVMLFWESAPQSGKDREGNATFAWEDEGKKVAMKLGDADIAELLAVLSGKKDFAGPAPKEGSKFPPGMFHKSTRGNSTLSFSRNENGDYKVRLSAKKDGNSNLIAVSHSLTIGEGEILETMLRAFLVKRFGWT